MRSYNLEKDFLNAGNTGTGIIYNQETEQFDVSLDIKTDYLIKITWKELVDLKSQSALEPGMFYRITDYEFTSTDPEVINAGHRFDIIVLALSENMLSEDARAIQHDFTEEEKEIYSEEEQHYFDASNLVAWKLKYSLEDTTRFGWAPKTKHSIEVYVPQSSSYRYLQRDELRDEQGYFAFQADGYTYYTATEEPTEKDQLYIKNNEQIEELFQYKIWYDVKRILIKDGDSDRYYMGFLDENDNYVKSLETSSSTIEFNDAYSLQILYWKGNSYIIIDNEYNFISENGISSKGILVTSNSSLSISFNDRSYLVQHPLFFRDQTVDVYLGDSYCTATLSKIPELGDTIEFKLGDDCYVPQEQVGPPEQNLKVNKYITYIEDYNKIKNILPKPKHRGTIYGMIDEYENDCEYDFKNALITGKYSLFDPEQFYYTFTNQGSNYIKLKDGNTPILLNPGTYTFLGCMPFRLYEEPNYITYVQPIITDEGYDSWDFYAALTNEEELDSETGETLYKVDMFVMPGFYTTNSTKDSPDNQHLIRVFEDKKWYVKELITYSNSVEGQKYIQVFSKDSDGNITVYETKVKEGYTEIFGEYLKTDKAWIYDACFKNNNKFQDFINLNINSDFTFDIQEGQQNYGRDINYSTNYEKIQFVVDNNGCYGVQYQYPYNDSYTVKWLKQGFPISVLDDNIEFATYYDTECKFTNTVTITEPMYVYIKDSKLLEQYISLIYTGDIILSPNESLETNQITYDLYTTARDGEFYEYLPTITKPSDTSCSYSDNWDVYAPDCYRVSLRQSMYSSWFINIPKVIMNDVQSSTIEAYQAFLQDCYCVKAKAGYTSSNKYLFLKNVRFSNLQDADSCILEDCYSITMEASQHCHIKDCSNTHIFNGQYSDITSVADSIIENVYEGNLCHIARSRITNPNYSGVCGVLESDISNLWYSQIENHNSYGDVNAWYNNYRNIYINGLKNKTVVLSDILNNNYTAYSSPGHCIHIRSEEDLTITV